MGTTEKSAANLNSMPNHPALAVLANRRDGLNRALETVERVMGSGGYQLEALVVLVAANLAGGHTNLLLIALFKMSARSKSLPLVPKLQCSSSPGPARNVPLH